MKKIIILSMALMLVCLMSVNAFAFESEGMEFPSYENVILENSEYPYYIISHINGDATIHFYFQLPSVTSFSSDVRSSISLKGDYGVEYYAPAFTESWELCSEGEISTILYVSDTIPNYSTIIDCNFDIVYEDIVFWDYDEPESDLTFCDGSTCPATDVNLDNICDDCGMTFAMVREFTPNDFPSGYPSVPSVSSDARYYLYRVHGSGSTYIVVYPSTVTPTYDTTKQNGYLTFSESYGSYRLDAANSEWVQNNDDSPYSIGGTNNNSVDVLYSSVTIKDQNGENFFPIPLWEKVEKVTQGEIPLFSQTLGGNLMILTLCGVGCLTLLMALVLLSKTLRIFRVR